MALLAGQVPLLPNYPPPPAPYGSHRVAQINQLELTPDIIKRLQLIDIGNDLTAMITVSDRIKQIINEKYQVGFEKDRASADRAFTRKPDAIKFVWDPDSMEVNMMCFVNGRLTITKNVAPRDNQRHTKHSLLLLNLRKLFYQLIRWNNRNVTFSEVALSFNSAANQVNQHLHLEGNEKIPMAWHFDKVKTHPRKLLQEHSMLGDLHESNADYLPEWAQKIQVLVEQGMTLNDIRDHPDKEVKLLYGMRSDAIRKGEIIVIHASGDDKHMVFPGELVQHLDQFIRDLKGGKNRYTNVLHTSLKFSRLGRTSKVNEQIPIINGDIFLQCACVDYVNTGKRIINATRCKHHFNLSDQGTYINFKTMLSKVPFDNEQLVSELINLLDDLRSPDVPGKHRIFSTCIHCGFRNKNPEAEKNATGSNPDLRHPSDITCQSCREDYCADCLSVHPGQICNGFKLDSELKNSDLNACPGCEYPTMHGGGCSFMICEGKCRRMWCWGCRELRHEEFAVHSREHYCLLNHTFQVNPVWRNNPNVRTYTVQPRQQTEPSDVVPLQRVFTERFIEDSDDEGPWDRAQLEDENDEGWNDVPQNEPW